MKQSVAAQTPITSLFTSVHDLDSLSALIDDRLKNALRFTAVLILLVSDDRESLQLHTGAPERFPVKDGFSDLLFNMRSPMILPYREFLQKKKLPAYFRSWTDRTISSIVAIPIISGNTPLGIVIYGYGETKRLTDEGLDTLQIAGDLLYITAVNALAREKAAETAQVEDFLLSMGNALARITGINDIHAILHEHLDKIIPHRQLSILAMGPEGQWQAVCSQSSPSLPVTEDSIDMIFASARPVFFKGAVFSPLINGKKRTGLLIIHTAGKTNLPPHTSRLIQAASIQIAAILAISAGQPGRQPDQSTRLQAPAAVDQDTVPAMGTELEKFHDLVGGSPLMRKTYHLITQVAKTQSSVLISGETGTGKELIARAIHNASSRKRREMIKVNCAAIQPNLIESELFGHEKGSFTGATERRIGKFEQAHNSTLLLDEIGELPLDLQVKLLRALQEREIERVGGRIPIKVNVRIIAATNRDLLKEVHKGNFRSDLYFRLNVFPILVPPLRERWEDIPMLASHFLTKHAKNGDKKIERFSSVAIKQLMAYSWPGNVRELEHQIEKHILTTNGTVMKTLSLPSQESRAIDSSLPGHIRTINEIEREHIMAVLKACRGKIFGIGGAAEKLKIPGTTLYSKMKRLHIKKHY